MRPRRLLYALTAVAIGATALAIGAPEISGATGDTTSTTGGANGAPSGPSNAELLEQAQRGNVGADYTGNLVVTWVDDAGARQEEEASVTYENGVMEISDHGRVVAATPGRLVLDGAAWSTSPSSGIHGAPEISSKYTVVREPSAHGATNGTVTLDARRKSDGALIERFTVDGKRGLVLQRESYDGSGHLERAVEFKNVVWTKAQTPAAAIKNVTSSGARLVKHIGEPYRAPKRAGDGFRLVARWRHPGSTVQLSYTDGLLSASVFEQPGELNWNALPAGGVVGNVGGRPAVAYSLPVGDVVVWDRAGMVYTAIGDAPRAELVSLANDVSRRSDNGAMTRLASVVLEPFRW